MRIENNTKNRIGVDERDLANIQNLVAVSLEKGAINSEDSTKSLQGGRAMKNIKSIISNASIANKQKSF